MQNNGSNQKTKEIQFSFDTVEAKNASLFGEYNEWNLNADHFPVTSWDESPEPQIYSQIVSYSSRTRGNEPNSFHF
jgi:hypothetical protein